MRVPVLTPRSFLRQRYILKRTRSKTRVAMESPDLFGMKKSVDELYKNIACMEKRLKELKEENVATSEAMGVAEKKLADTMDAYHKAKNKVQLLQFNIDQEQEAIERQEEANALLTEQIDKYTAFIEASKATTLELGKKFNEDMRSIIGKVKTTKRFYLPENVWRKFQSVEQQIEELSLRDSRLAEATQDAELGEHESFLRSAEAQLTRELLLQENRAAWRAVEVVQATEEVVQATGEELEHVPRSPRR